MALQELSASSEAFSVLANLKIGLISGVQTFPSWLIDAQALGMDNAGGATNSFALY